MGIIQDLINRKRNREPEIDIKDVEIRDAQQDGIPMEARYNRSWLNRAILHNGFSLNRDEAFVDEILGRIWANGGQCPSANPSIGQNIDYRCPCKNMRFNGVCKCGLFEQVKRRKIVSTTTGRID